MRANIPLVQVLSVALLGGAGPVSAASPIEKVCRTDIKTLENIRADADQTLWNFMLSVCGERLSTMAPPQPSSVQATNSPGIFITSEPKGDLVQQASQEMQRPSSLLGELTPPEHALALPDRMGNDSSERASLSSIGAEAFMLSRLSTVEETTIESNWHARAVAETSATLTKRERSIYELLETISADQVNEVLPPPLDYKPTRFSQYRPDPYSDWSASNQGRGYLKKPSVMETVPYGLYVGTSLSSSLPADGTSRSEFPSVIVGYSDERAIRDFKNFHGGGFRLEGEVARDRSKNEGMVSTRDNRYSVTGEIYQPLGAGYFLGLGTSYESVRNVLLQPIGQQALGEYDLSGYDIYIPMGLGFVTPGGRSGKVQLDLLVLSQIKAKWTSLSGNTLSDTTIKRGFGRGVGFEVSYSPFPSFEPFLRYEWIDKSKPYDFTLNGAVLSNNREPVSRALEMGLRYYW